MTEISGAERIVWQRQAHALLGRLLELAAKDSLPAIAWTVQDVGASLRGEFYARPYALRRQHYGAWKAALTALAGDPEAAREHASGDGQIRLVTAWERVPVRAGEHYPSARITLVASIWPDDEEG